MKFKSLLAVATLAAAALTVAPANATSVSGSFAPNDGLLNNFSGATTSIVSGLSSFTLGPIFSNFSCTAGSTFAALGCLPAGVTNNQPLVIGSDANYLTYEGISFNVAGFGPTSITAFTCGGILGPFCKDQITFAMVGLTSGGGFDPTPFLWSFTATGTCTQAGAAQSCVLGTASGSWSSSISTAGPLQTPEPGTLALLGLGLTGLGMVRRRKKS